MARDTYVGLVCSAHAANHINNTAICVAMTVYSAFSRSPDIGSPSDLRKYYLHTSTYIVNSNLMTRELCILNQLNQIFVFNTI